MLPGMARDFLIGLGVRDGEEWRITLDLGVALNRWSSAFRLGGIGTKWNYWRIAIPVRSCNLVAIG